MVTNNMNDTDRRNIAQFKHAAAKLGMKIKVEDERLAELLREIIPAVPAEDDKPLPWPP